VNIPDARLNAGFYFSRIITCHIPTQFFVVPHHHTSTEQKTLQVNAAPFIVQFVSYNDTAEYRDFEASSTVKMSDAQANEAEKNIEIWKVKKLIKRLEAARGNGTSMISLIIRRFCFCLNFVQILITTFQLPRIRFLEQQRCWLKNTYVLPFTPSKPAY
jgi:hypothetical protein